jgi:hypothetical protein
MRSHLQNSGPIFCDTERRDTPPLTVPQPAFPSVPEPISELRQEIGDMHVQQPPTLGRRAAAFGNQVEEIATRHPGAAVLSVFGLGLAVGTALWLLKGRCDTA